MDVIMIPFHDYKKWEDEGFRTRDAHLYEHFCSSDRVGTILVINRPTSFAELILKRRSWHTKSGEIVYKRGGVCLTKKNETSYCLDILLPDTLKVLLQKKSWWFTAFQYPKVIGEINAAIQYLGLSEPVLLLQNPMAIGTVSGVSHGKFVFDAIDNWLYHPQMKDKQLIKKNYKYVETHADLIMTVSEALAEFFSGNGNVKWHPNGVDINYFKDAFTGGNNNCVGYVGKIQDRVDLDLVEKCLKAMPDTEFVFLGPVYSQNNRIKQLCDRYKNIRFAGDIHYSELPKAMKRFCAAIIPHKVDRFTDSMNPLKLYEYLAAGKQVVTTPIAGVDGISKYVYAANDSDGFIRLIQSALNNLEEKKVTSAEITKTIPEECTWKYRTECILDDIEKLSEV